MDSTPKMTGTYIGDYFTFYPFPGQDNPGIKNFKGERCQLIGFKYRLDYVTHLSPSCHYRQKGIYRVMGDPVVRFSGAQLFQVSLCELTPEGYSLDDLNHPKNIWYIREASKFQRVSDLPDSKADIGDRVLVGSHLNVPNDIEGIVLEIHYTVTSNWYTILSDDRLYDVQERFVIDVLEQCKPNDPSVLILPGTAGQRYLDLENLQTPELEPL